jgi:hypothetical protein
MLTESSLERSTVMQTVGEEHPKGLNSVLDSLGWLRLPFIMALAYLPLRKLVKYKEVDYDLLPFLYAAITFYLYVNRAKMAYVFAPAAMLVVAIVLADMFRFGEMIGRMWGKDVELWTKRLAIALIFVLLFSQLSVGINTIESLKKSFTPEAGWIKLYDYMKTLPDNTLLMTWWDYGHWSAWNNINTTLDNTNHNQTKVIETAKIFTDLRGLNQTEELELAHLSQLRSWEVTNVAVDRILLYQKWGALTFLGNRQCIPTKELRQYGLQFVAEMEQTGCGPGYTYSGDIGIAPCSLKTISSVAGQEQYVECYMFQDQPIQFTMDEWSAVKATPWPGYPLTIQTSTGTASLRVYGTPDNMIMFFHMAGRVLPDAPINYMYGFRLFFKDPSLKYHKLVENQFVPNEEVVLYDVTYPPGIPYHVNPPLAH